MHASVHTKSYRWRVRAAPTPRSSAQLTTLSVRPKERAAIPPGLREMADMGSRCRQLARQSIGSRLALQSTGDTSYERQIEIQKCHESGRAGHHATGQRAPKHGYSRHFERRE